MDKLKQGNTVELIGKITTKNDDLSYGFVSVPKFGDIFFSKDTTFSDTTFDDVCIDQKVKITAVETARGLFATSFQLVSIQKPKVSPEQAIL